MSKPCVKLAKKLWMSGGKNCDNLYTTTKLKKNKTQNHVHKPKLFQQLIQQFSQSLSTLKIGRLYLKNLTFTHNPHRLLLSLQSKIY